MVVLRRNQLVWLSDAGWRELKRPAGDDNAVDCMAHWAARRLPLVVTRQTPALAAAAPAAADVICLGLPAPTRWGRRKIALQAPRSSVLIFDVFPLAAEITRLLDREHHGPWLDLCTAVGRLGVTARVHGGHGWQRLTGLPYLHALSDIDLHLSVGSVAQADAVVALLAAAAFSGPRIDGELVFPDGAAVAWREWRQWRQGLARQVLVKRLSGAALESGLQWLLSDEPDGRHAAQAGEPAAVAA